ncbi:MAG: DNA repair exonuclease [Opitutaceae bacterium]|nr:DNA repair exonuclease [Opitutaceae bacterium]
MFRFIHSADWQLGARFSQFGARASQLREARLTTLRRALDLARQQAVDAFLIAGDLFEDNQVDNALVTAVIDLFRERPDVPVYLLPGNHDPASGPDSIWERPAFRNAPSHVRVLTTAQALDLGGGVHLLAAPLHQKLSTLDPSLKLRDLAASLPSGTLKIGLTHGALAIEGKHQPNDFPIALDAASRAGLDYLAIGHWHSWISETDGGRIVMPGTPEPDRFDHERCGQVALVELAGPGVPAKVVALPVATLTWESLSFDFLSADASRSSLEHAFNALRERAATCVVRVTLKGNATPQGRRETLAWLEGALAPFFVSQRIDRTALALSAPELADLQHRHPLLAQVLNDIDRMEVLATGSGSVSLPPLGEGTGVAAVAPPTAPLSLAEAQRLLDHSRTDLASLKTEDFVLLRQVLLQTLQEVAP